MKSLFPYAYAAWTCFGTYWLHCEPEKRCRVLSLFLDNFWQMQTYLSDSNSFRVAFICYVTCYAEGAVIKLAASPCICLYLHLKLLYFASEIVMKIKLTPFLAHSLNDVHRIKSHVELFCCGDELFCSFVVPVKVA